MTLAPDFSMYRFYASLAEADCVVFPKGEALTVDVDAVIEACRKEQIRLLVFFQPLQPDLTGAAAGGGAPVDPFR